MKGKEAGKSLLRGDLILTMAKERRKNDIGTTVMIRFSARGAYLLLAPQERALIRDRALI